MAPEVLRGVVLDAKDLKMADVYSFGIIIEEITTRNWPYDNILHDRCDDEAIQGILEKLKNVQIPPFRPHVPQYQLGEQFVGEIMRLCWHELPSSRPMFDNILVLLRKVKKGRNKNIMDHVIHMMSKYSDHLEEMIEERTTELVEEKKRSEEVFCYLLPKAVSEILKSGKTVEPESFTCVTVFFSDVIGFTQIAAESTPHQVVGFLNSLYTLFDTIINKFDVYKLETIGDTYMVVSGIPIRNGIHHAGEICTMALHLLSSVLSFKIAHRPNKKVDLRIGIHSGPVVAGVVGHMMPRYCLFGETVTYASYMESSGFGQNDAVMAKT
ncbi:atrial natriuretic peptide receptor 1-like [Gigantopelta aegis]|uniref:atrial natriuretic peptide receptor 1-like n=1 Tax=Gigantopelta aegis TaxID=1735272 RepID=UPI001B88C70C|nr:atrial natriuretic peptide receptor 1-like [Gigantopelta aegis]